MLGPYDDSDSIPGAVDATARNLFAFYTRNLPVTVRVDPADGSVSIESEMPEGVEAEDGADGDYQGPVFEESDSPQLGEEERAYPTRSPY